MKEEDIQVGDLVYWYTNRNLVGLVEEDCFFDFIIHWFDVNATQRNSKLSIRKLQ
jgi:hypothetical protein